MSWFDSSSLQNTFGSSTSIVSAGAGLLSEIGSSVSGTLAAGALALEQIAGAAIGLSDIGSYPVDQINLNDTAGRRVRLRPKPNGTTPVYGSSNGLLSVLSTTNGLVFPYQPTITWQQEVQYTEMELIHTNQDIQAYKRTPSLKLSVDGEFTVQNQTEGLYALACIHFLRVVTKMYFGDSDPNRGTPPPVLCFDAYGAYMFNSLPVIVTNFAITLPKDVDYVPVDASGVAETANQTGNWDSLTNAYLSDSDDSNIAWLPSLFSIQVQLTIQHTPARLRTFSLEDFRTGTLLQSGGWV